MSSTSTKFARQKDGTQFPIFLSRRYRQIGLKAVAAGVRLLRKANTKRNIVQRSIPMNDDRASRATRESFDRTMATGADAVRGVQEGFTSALENVRDLNVRLIDMARVNTDAAFDFAREVATVKGPSDLVQACTKHATKQFDVLTKQASELTTLGQRLAKTTTDTVTRVGQASKPE